MLSRPFTSKAPMAPSIIASTRTMMTRRSFMQGRSLALKESSHKDPDPEASHRHKEDSLAKQRQGKGHWKPELASDSEESVKADRMDPEGSDEATIKRLQERTKQAAEEKSKNGTSMRDGL